MKSRLFVIFAAVCALGAQAAYADPVENPILHLRRGVQEGNLLSGELSKNVYRYVEREIVENVQVPYEVTVPYEVPETYYDSEQRCGYEPRRVCHNEQRCYPGRPIQHECRIHNGMRVCPPPVMSPPTCTIEPVCSVRSQYECHLVQVPRTRIVTRYRTEVRYRIEQRHRTVTDQIYDRQWGVQVKIALPEDASLQGNEVEVVHVALKGSESAPQADVSVDSPVFNYRVANQSIENRVITITLALVAKYQPQDLAEQTILGLAMVRAADGKHVVQFEDRGLVARTQTHYKVYVADKDTGEWIFQTELDGSLDNRQIAVPVEAAVQEDHDHVIRLQVSRDGKVITAPVRFTKDANQVGQLNPALYLDPNGVREFAVKGEEAAATLEFVDQTPNDAKVETRYEIKLQRKALGFLWKVTMAEATVLRKDLVNEAGKVKIALAKFPGIDDREVRKFLDAGDQLFVEIRVARVSPRLQGVSPIAFTKEAKLKVQK